MDTEREHEASGQTEERIEMSTLSEYSYYDDRFWSSVQDHESGACQSKLCLYCASVGIHIAQQKLERNLTPGHREAIALHD